MRSAIGFFLLFGILRIALSGATSFRPTCRWSVWCHGTTRHCPRFLRKRQLH